MILSGPEIVRVVKETKYRKMGGDFHSLTEGIDIEPFDPERVGPNSYDLTLSDTLLQYTRHNDPSIPLSTRGENPSREFPIQETGFLLRPGIIYLASTLERTACAGYVPWIEGRSSLGRLGLNIHATAGFGDDGFGWPDGASWTLELFVVEPVVIYPGLRICQLVFSTLFGTRKPYKGKYNDQADKPVASRLHLDK